MNPNRRGVLKGIGATGILVATGAGLSAAADDDTAKVRVIHASPDAPNVDVYVDGSKALSDVPFTAISDYLDVPAGERTVKITAAGDPSTVAFEGPVTVEGGTFYSVAAIGELSEGTFTPKVVEDPVLDEDAHYSGFRPVHASPDAPAIDVTIADYPLYLDVEFGDVGRAYRVRSGEWTIGIDAASDGTVVYENTTELQEGVTYTLYATGYLTPDDEPADNGFEVLAGTTTAEEDDDEDDDRPAPAQVRVAHASPDAPNVDVYVDGSKALSDVPFTAISDYLDVPAGERTVKITAAGDPSTVAFEGPVTLESGTAYTVAAIGELSEGTFRPKILVDDADPDEHEGAVRVLHASPDAPAVDVTTRGATLVDGLAFGSTTDYRNVNPGRYELAVRPDSPDNDNPFDAEIDATVPDGEPVTAIATGYFTAFDEPADEQFTVEFATDETAD